MSDPANIATAKVTELKAATPYFDASKREKTST
jgi:hypothetical protein